MGSTHDHDQAAEKLDHFGRRYTYARSAAHNAIIWDRALINLKQG